jgi:hypothetical protein
MVRLSHSKRDVDLAPNTIRKYHRENGLPIYWVGKSAFFSRSELAALIKATAQPQPPSRKKPEPHEPREIDARAYRKTEVCPRCGDIKKRTMKMCVSCDLNQHSPETQAMISSFENRGAIHAAKRKAPKFFGLSAVANSLNGRAL